MKVPLINLSQQIRDLGPELEETVLNVLRSGQYIGGSHIKKFEEAFASTMGTTYAVSCNSGTDALILALRALGIGTGDEVITSSFSFFATAEAISAVGATPVFVDVNLATYLMEFDQIEAAITPATKALIPVHLFGRPLNMTRLMRIAKSYNLKVIEDCAQATGTTWEGEPVGSFGDIGCFSFFPTKNLGGIGDGGASTTNNESLALSMRELSVHGMAQRYLHTNLGYNSRLDSIQGAVLNVKLPKLRVWVERRKEIAMNYIEQLADTPGLKLPSNEIGHSWNQFVVRVTSCPEYQHKSKNSNLESSTTIAPGESYCRDWLKQKMHQKGINTIIYYPIPIHLQPAYSHLKIKQESLRFTERLCGQVLSLPIFPELTDLHQQWVVNVLKQLLSNSNQDRMVA